MNAAPTATILPALFLALAGCSSADAGRTGSVTSADGVSIDFETRGSGDPALLFVHGWACDRTYWSRQVEFFSADHRVVAVDLAGHGDSGLDREAWSISAFAEDVRRVAEFLHLERIILVGHSMGGAVIIEAARLMPDRVIALVPVDSLQDVERRYSERERAEFLAPLRADFRARTTELVRESMFDPGTDPALVERIARDMASTPPRAGIGAMEALLSFDLAASLAQVQAPIRCINSDLYPTDVHAGQRFTASFDVRILPGVGHFLMLEAPDPFNRLLAQAIHDLTPRKP